MVSMKDLSGSKNKIKIRISQRIQHYRRSPTTHCEANIVSLVSMPDDEAPHQQPSLIDDAYKREKTDRYWDWWATLRIHLVWSLRHSIRHPILVFPEDRLLVDAMDRSSSLPRTQRRKNPPSRNTHLHFTHKPQNMSTEGQTKFNSTQQALQRPYRQVKC